MLIRLESLLKESPDQIPDKNNKSVVLYDWEGKDVIGFFTVIDSHELNRTFSIICDKKHREIITDDTEIERIYPEYNDGDMKWHRLKFEHHYLNEPLKDAGIIKWHGRDADELPVSGRIWDSGNNNSKYVCSFWQNHDKVKQYHSHINNVFVLLGISIRDSVFEFIGNEGEFFTYEEAFLGDTKIKSKITPEQEKALLKIQHLSPAAKRALATNYPPNRLQVAAEKLGISYAQLRHILSGPEMVGKTSFEENLDISSFLDDDKLNFSDYYSPDIPYEVKPVPSLKPME